MRSTGAVRSGVGVLPFGDAWLESFESIIAGARVGRRLRSTEWLQFLCRDADRVRPWAIEVVDGTVNRVTPTLRPDAVLVLSHSVAVGWRLLGLSVRGFHRLDELVVEQRTNGRWSPHALPPLDDAVIDLAVAEPHAFTHWHERVVDSPLGTLYVSRRLADGKLRLCAASTTPPAPDESVMSEVTWDALMDARQRGPRRGADGSRVWRGAPDAVDTVRSVVVHGPAEPFEPRVRRLRRDRGLLDGLAVLAAARTRLRGDARWCELWQPSSRRPPP
jgi:hypothetical protein